MIKPLRKKHLQIWMLLAILIPAGIISAYMAVPKEVLNKLLQQDQTEALPVEVKKIEQKNYHAFLRCSANKKNYQLQLNVIDESTTPSSLLYQINFTEKELVGRIATKGTYYFSVEADSSNNYHFILYDIIHHQNIDTLNF